MATVLLWNDAPPVCGIMHPPFLNADSHDSTRHVFASPVKRERINQMYGLEDQGLLHLNQPEAQNVQANERSTSGHWGGDKDYMHDVSLRTFQTLQPLPYR